MKQISSLLYACVLLLTAAGCKKESGPRPLAEVIVNKTWAGDLKYSSPVYTILYYVAFNEEGTNTNRSSFVTINL